MYEYQKTREPEIRKNCMEIAKELRKLRKMQDNQKGNHNKWWKFIQFSYAITYFLYIYS